MGRNILMARKTGGFELAAIQVLSAGAPKTGVARCAAAFERASGISVAYRFATATALRQAVGGGEADAEIVVAPVEAVADFEALGLVTGTTVVLGGVAAGVVVRDDDAPDPDISSANSLKAAILAADRLVYNEGSSGLYIAKLMERLGIAEAVAGKTERVANGAAVMAKLVELAPAGAIGFGQVTEIRLHAEAGVRLVGPLPDPVGNVTTYGAALLSGTGGPARDFLAYLATGEAHEILVATGILR
jgi:molybdate transport system substrate-binding protein